MFAFSKVRSRCWHATLIYFKFTRDYKHWCIFILISSPKTDLYFRIICADVELKELAYNIFWFLKSVLHFMVIIRIHINIRGLFVYIFTDTFSFVINLEIVINIIAVCQKKYTKFYHHLANKYNNKLFGNKFCIIVV